jgi:hypothetical protein
VLLLRLLLLFPLLLQLPLQCTGQQQGLAAGLLPGKASSLMVVHPCNSSSVVAGCVIL